MSECFSKVPSNQINNTKFTASIHIDTSFYLKSFPKIFRNTIQEINIISDKELALSSLDYLDHIQLTESSDYDESNLSEAFDSSTD